MIKLGIHQRSTSPTRRSHTQIHRFLQMCEDFARFLQENGGQNLKAYLARDCCRFGLYLTTTSEPFDFELSRKLTEFAAPYITCGLLASVSLLPASSPEELTAFFDPATAIRIEGEHA